MARHLNDKRPFRFKQFSMNHHNSSMKVGTDAILLAAWAKLDKSSSILDVGSGSGIISLILASRCDAMIDAVEIDVASVEESSQNFSKSKFSHRLKVILTDYTKYASSCYKQYDLIISNPPFFTDYSFKPKEQARQHARHTDKLGFEQLCESTIKLLKPNGIFCLVLPKQEEDNFLKIATLFNLHLQKKLSIFPKRNRAANRVNLQLGYMKTNDIKTEEFTIRENDLTFTEQYIDFLKDHYIDLD